MKTNKELKEAMEDLDEISKQKELRRVAELREKAIKDEKNAITHANISLYIYETKEILIKKGRNNKI